MTMPSQQRSSRLQTPDLEKVRIYLVNSLTRELEANPPPVNRRREFITQKLDQVYEQTQLRLADTLRKQIYRDVLDDLLDPNMPGATPENAVGLEEFGSIMQQGGVAGQQAQLAQALGGR